MRTQSIHDKVQEQICLKLAYTEHMMAHVLKTINGYSCDVEITTLEDLGFSNNFIRMRGGFYTGIAVNWHSSVPFIPVDTTVNSCGVSIFEFDQKLDTHEFKRRISELDIRLKAIGINNNFSRGNHFISLCTGSDGMQYLVLHASDDLYKYGEFGLYPREDSWYYEQIQTEHFHDGYLKYIIGDTAERFHQLYLESEKNNSIRNRTVAGIILDGCTGIREVLYSPHYGMPNQSSIAIGSQWRKQDAVLLTYEGAPIYIISEIGNQVAFIPHGFGVTIEEDCHSLMFSEEEIIINNKAFHCKNGFLSCGIAKTRNSDIPIDRNAIMKFMPSRSLTIINELKQKCSYTRKGFNVFE